MAVKKPITVVKDRGAEFILKQAKIAEKGPHVKVGYPADKMESRNDGITNLELAIIHEFGTTTIPQRSFIRSTYDEKVDENFRFIKQLHGKVLEQKMSIEQALNIIGLKVQSQIKDKILSNIPPPIQDETARRKGSSVALVDTGQMLNAVTYQVKLGNSD